MLVKEVRLLNSIVLKNVIWNLVAWIDPPAKPCAFYKNALKDAVGSKGAVSYLIGFCAPNNQETMIYGIETKDIEYIEFHDGEILSIYQ